MEALRWVTNQGQSLHTPCSRCEAAGCPWDQVAAKPICPDCQELLARGEGPPLIERVERKPCVVCDQVGTLRFLTLPLHGSEAIEMDLCGAHFQALVRRQLDRFSYHQLCRRLKQLGVHPREVFLLHEAFYDEFGHPLQPVQEPFV
jgi:hypothetical protein